MPEKRTDRPKARVPRGFRDRGAAEIAAERACLDTLRRVFEAWGFEALETPAFEYTEALGKFLPDLDRPNEGVFSLLDDDGQWLSLRYDLTAPLARYVAENFQILPKPFRRYQVGSVWRNEKPGPGRYREFTQFDADTVGSASPAADAELLLMASDALEALGLGRDEFILKFNSRRLLDGVLESCGLALDGSREAQLKRGVVLRAIDKLDRLGISGVRALLGEGRKDESGDFTQGAHLSSAQIQKIESFVVSTQDSEHNLESLRALVAGIPVGEQGLAELAAIELLTMSHGRVRFDPSIVRGLEYYTGAVFEAQLTFPVKNDEGDPVVMGSVAGGGRYDDLVARFTGERVPATGISIGVSRLLNALRQRNGSALSPLVVVLALDKEDRGRSFALASELRGAGIRSEAYVGEGGMKAQFRYADRRNAALAIIEGADERARGEITIKDLAAGAELAKSVDSRAEWVKDRPAQISVPRTELVAKAKELLGSRASTNSA
ncbi:MAG TPA: histidine--tRNA ligase [Rhizomicrobium sp.]|jgi:histidyl-tRNA synthetase|nr:histidine--tRNA ligase [Rhizomicrobium sp.]